MACLIGTTSAALTNGKARGSSFAVVVVLIGFLACLSQPTEAKPARRKGGFLSKRINLLSGDLLHQELENAVTGALGLGHGLSKVQLEAKTEKIQAMFETMPKNMWGRVGRESMVYMVSRYFGREHGWSIKGFDPSSTAASMNQTESEDSSMQAIGVLKEKLPMYVEEVLEHRLENEGFALQDVVAVTVILERLIFDECTEMLEDAYYLQEKNPNELLDIDGLADVITTYMTIYAFQAYRRNRTELPRTFRKIARDYPSGWPSGIYGIAETQLAMEEMRIENPFTDMDDIGYSFEVASRSVMRASEGYGQWTNEQQCVHLKDALIELDPDSSGRVKLVDFYKRGVVNHNWFLQETEDYLRATGSLDESSPSKGPQVIISNYVQAPSNCLEVSSFYSICCLKECESLLGQIEREIRAPFASPDRILPSVQRLIDTKEDEERNLTSQMISQLQVVAEHHGGRVPLHGRLFQQWLHYVFPYECPYPQLTADATNHQVTSDYFKATGLHSLHSRDEVEEYIAQKEKEEEAEKEAEKDVDGVEQTDDVMPHGMSMWTMEEELYVGYHHQKRMGGIRSSWAWLALSRIAKVGMVVGGFLALRPFAAAAYREFAQSPNDARKKPWAGLGIGRTAGGNEPVSIFV